MGPALKRRLARLPHFLTLYQDSELLGYLVQMEHGLSQVPLNATFAPLGSNAMIKLLFQLQPAKV